jgi:hypothetical protein
LYKATAAATSAPVAVRHPPRTAAVRSPLTSSPFAEDMFLSPTTSEPIFQTSELDLLHRQKDEAVDLAEFSAQRAARDAQGFRTFLEHVEENRGPSFLRLLRKMGRLRTVVEAILAGGTTNVLLNDSASPALKMSVVAFLQLVAEDAPSRDDLACMNVVYETMLRLGARVGYSRWRSNSAVSGVIGEYYNKQQ